MKSNINIAMIIPPICKIKLLIPISITRLTSQTIKEIKKENQNKFWGFKTKFIDSKKNMQDQDFQVSISQSVFALQDWESTIPLSHRKNSSKLWPISQVVEISPDKWNIWTCFSRDIHQKLLVLLVTVPVDFFAQANYKDPSSH